jgi:large subunit ribosomal protein L7A
MEHEELRGAKNKVIGTKQAHKHLVKGDVIRLYVARDAEEHVVRGVLSAARERGIEVAWVDSMKELGRACGIEVGAATVALLRPEGEGSPGS